MREELIQRNVARLVTLPQAPPARNRPLAAARSDPLYLAIVLLIVYGLRRGEVLGLSWNDVDFESNTFQVRQQLLRVGHALQLGPVKTSASKRELPLLGIAREAFLSHEALRTLGGPETVWTLHQLVFTSRTGAPVEPRNVARSFERIAQVAGLRRIRTHDLRHTTATLLKTLKVQPREGWTYLVTHGSR